MKSREPSWCRWGRKKRRFQSFPEAFLAPGRKKAAKDEGCGKEEEENWREGGSGEEIRDALPDGKELLHYASDRLPRRDQVMDNSDVNSGFRNW